MEKKKKNIESILVDSLKSKITNSEQQDLQDWKKIEGNEKEYADLQNTWDQMQQLSEGFSVEAGWTDFEKRIQHNKERTTTVYWATSLTTIAAMLILALGISVYNAPKIMPPTANVNTLGIKNADGEWIDLSTEGNISNQNKYTNKIVEIDINAIEMHISQKGLNEITVPRGKRLKIYLSDSSEVWLASTSKLLFPETFEGEKREVELIGQGYFKIRKNKDKPFIVKSRSRSIMVLGTEFNIDNSNIDFEQTTLVEGSVAILNSKGQEETKLTPSEQFTLNQKTDKWTKEVVDTKPYTSWINGSLVFEDVSFEDLKGKLEKWYGVKIINTASNLNKETFTGEFDGRDNIISVMQLFEMSNDIQYVIENDTVKIY